MIIPTAACARAREVSHPIEFAEKLPKILGFATLRVPAAGFCLALPAWANYHGEAAAKYDLMKSRWQSF